MDAALSAFQFSQGCRIISLGRHLAAENTLISKTANTLTAFTALLLLFYSLNKLETEPFTADLTDMLCYMQTNIFCIMLEELLQSLQVRTAALWARTGLSRTNVTAEPTCKA